MSSSASYPRGSFSADASLLRRVRAHDRDAWNRLTDLYGPLVFHWGKRYGLSNEDAADVLQSMQPEERAPFLVGEPTHQAPGYKTLS